MRITFGLIILCLFCGGVFASAHGGELNSSPKSNVMVIQELVASLTDSLLTDLNLPRSSKVGLKLPGVPDIWIAGSAVNGSLVKFGIQTFDAGDTSAVFDKLLNLENVEYRIKYVDPFRAGFLSEKKITRHVSLSAALRFTDIGTKEVLHSGTFSRQSADTIAVDDIPDVESKTAPTTKGEYQSESFFEKIAEPVIIIGATGLSIYLFFKIRS